MKKSGLFGILLLALIVRLPAVQEATTPTPAATAASAAADLSHTDLHRLFDETYQFLYFATLEGLMRDGVTDAEVTALLERADNGKGAYLNFVYSCPTCTPVRDAVVLYQKRPPITEYKINNFQTQNRTMGFGLSKEISALLLSTDHRERLQGVYLAVNHWVNQRMDEQNLSAEQRKILLAKLEEGRKQGAALIASFAGRGSIKAFAPGYAAGGECAICNAAAQNPLKLWDVPAPGIPSPMQTPVAPN